MKAYIVTIELLESSPLIWRRVIFPAGATFRRLHEIIQNVSNFQSGYPGEGYHLYEFDLSQENLIVTEDEEAFLEHQHYMRNLDLFAERLRTLDPEMLPFEKAYQERLKIDVRNPSRLKVDSFLEKYKIISYAYDFGDDWHFSVKLENIVDDYHFGYPTLLDGAETAPPEDVGGIDGFYEFLAIYRNAQHKEHAATKKWAESMRFESMIHCG